MMNTDDYKKDDFTDDGFLRDLIRNSPLDSPSEGFVERVMAQIEPSPEVSPAKKPFYLYLKAVVPYVVIAIIVVMIVATSDLPIFNWFPGKKYVTTELLPYLGSLFAVFKTAFASKAVSWVLLISFSAGMLYLVDRLVTRRSAA
jgi:hypothetical protein